jgi:hypothetical protein
MIFKRITLPVLIVLGLLMQGSWAQAAILLAKTGTHSYTVPFVREDVSLSGSAGSSETTFQLPSYWEVSRVKLLLEVQVSTVSRKEWSTVTLLLNGNPFYSFHPETGTEIAQRLEIPVPPGLLVQGSNALKLQTELRSYADEQVCQEDTGIGHWLRIGGASRIETEYTLRPVEDSIRDFNARITGPDAVASGRSLVALPADSKAADWEAAVYALTGYARTNLLSENAIPLLPYSAEHVQNKDYVTVVGLYDSLPQELKEPAVAGFQTPPDLDRQGLIRLVNIQDKAVLIVTSRSPELLVKAGRLVANQEQMAQAAGNTLLLDAATDVAKPAAGFTREIRLTESGNVLTGPFHQEYNYYIAMPGNLELGDASKINLDFRYAENLNFDRALMTVKINGVPIGSKKLHKELAQADRAVFTVPGDLTVSGNFTVTVAFDLEANFNACAAKREDTPWAYITPESLLQLQTRQGTELLLNNYPYPFIQDGQFASVSVVLPDRRDNELYRTVGNLFHLLGRYAVSNMGEIKFSQASAGPEELKDRNLIVIGSFGDNAFIRANNDKLYFRYNGDGARFLSNEKISLEAGYASTIGTLQLLPSPYGNGGMLVVTGVEPESVFRASRLLAGEEVRWRIYGDGVFTDRDGRIQPYRFKKTAAPKPLTGLDEILQRQDVVTFTAAAILVLALVLVSLILLVRKHTRRKTAQSKPALPNEQLTRRKRP